MSSNHIPDEFIEILSRIEQRLSCCMCQAYESPEFFNCGHVLCTSCCENTKSKCPLCKTSIIEPASSRNRILDNVIPLLKCIRDHLSNQEAQVSAVQDGSTKGISCGAVEGNTTHTDNADEERICSEADSICADYASTVDKSSSETQHDCGAPKEYLSNQEAQVSAVHDGSTKGISCGAVEGNTTHTDNADEERICSEADSICAGYASTVDKSSSETQHDPECNVDVCLSSPTPTLTPPPFRIPRHGRPFLSTSAPVYQDSPTQRDASLSSGEKQEGYVPDTYCAPVSLSGSSIFSPNSGHVTDKPIALCGSSPEHGVSEGEGSLCDSDADIPHLTPGRAPERVMDTYQVDSLHFNSPLSPQSSVHSLIHQDNSGIHATTQEAQGKGLILEKDILNSDTEIGSYRQCDIVPDSYDVPPVPVVASRTSATVVGDRNEETPTQGDPYAVHDDETACGSVAAPTHSPRHCFSIATWGEEIYGEILHLRRSMEDGTCPHPPSEAMLHPPPTRTVDSNTTICGEPKNVKVENKIDTASLPRPVDFKIALSHSGVRIRHSGLDLATKELLKTCVDRGVVTLIGGKLKGDWDLLLVDVTDDGARRVCERTKKYIQAVCIGPQWIIDGFAWLEASAKRGQCILPPEEFEIDGTKHDSCLGGPLKSRMAYRDHEGKSMLLSGFLFFFDSTIEVVLKDLTRGGESIDEGELMWMIHMCGGCALKSGFASAKVIDREIGDADTRGKKCIYLGKGRLEHKNKRKNDGDIKREFSAASVYRIIQHSFTDDHFFTCHQHTDLQRAIFFEGILYITRRCLADRVIGLTVLNTI